MATVQVWDVKGRLDHPLDYAANPDKTDRSLYSKAELDGLKDVMDYAANDVKTFTTDHQHCVTGINCSWDTAREDMIRTKTQFMDDKEIVAFHAFQSFKHGEVTPEVAHQVGIEFAQRMWGERFQVLVATHLNTDCIHSHFVINSTSFVDGKRYYDNKDSLKRARQISDEVCREYGLSVITEKEGGNIPIALYKKEKAGMPTRYNVARQAIDEAITHSLSTADFEKQLRKMGYKFQFSERRTHWTITPKGWDKPIRLKQLGEGYSKEDIAQRIQENSPEMVMDTFHGQNRQLFVNVRFDTRRHATTLRGLYRHYCYLLGILPKLKKQNPARLHHLLKDDLLKMDYISQETKFLYENGIDTLEQLSDFRDDANQQIESLMKERRRLWNSLRRVQEPVDESVVKEQIGELSAQLKKRRREIKMCESVARRAPEMQVKNEAIYNEERQNQKKHEL